MVYKWKPLVNGWFGGTPIFGNTRLETLITYDVDKEALYVNASSTQCWMMAWDV